MAILLIFWINLTKLEGIAQGKIAHVLNSPGSQVCKTQRWFNKHFSQCWRSDHRSSQR